MKQSIIKEKAKIFAFKAIDVYKELIMKKEFVLSKQFLRSATSIGANINEALAGYSKKDFAHKMSISSKEARETLYWIELIEYGNFINFNFSELKHDADEIIKILTAIVKTSQKEV